MTSPKLRSYPVIRSRPVVIPCVGRSGAIAPIIISIHERKTPLPGGHLQPVLLVRRLLQFSTGLQVMCCDVSVDCLITANLSICQLFPERGL